MLSSIAFLHLSDPTHSNLPPSLLPASSLKAHLLPKDRNISLLPNNKAMSAAQQVTLTADLSLTRWVKGHTSSADGGGLAHLQDGVPGVVFAHLLRPVEGWCDRLPAPPSSLAPSWHDNSGDPGTDERSPSAEK